MLEESYVSFELAKLLKEKNFPQDYNEYHDMVYNEETYEDEYEVQRMVTETETIEAGTLSFYPAGVPKPKCYAPTLSLVSKWLREEKDLAIAIESSQRDNHYYWINKIDELHPDAEYVSPNVFKTYDEALADAIETALKYLL